jgi:hypothetical protein
MSLTGFFLCDVNHIGEDPSKFPGSILAHISLTYRNLRWTITPQLIILRYIPDVLKGLSSMMAGRGFLFCDRFYSMGGRQDFGTTVCVDLKVLRGLTLRALVL